MPSQCRNQREARRRSSGAVVLELILALPLLIIVLLGILEFGVMLNNLQYLSFSARTGAQLAAQLPPGDFYPGPAVPTVIVNAVNQELANSSPASIAPLSASSILIEHRIPAVGTGADVTVHELVYGAPVTGVDVVAPPVPSPPAYRYVRVTVFVDATDLAPNLLAAFGVDFSGQRVQQTVTFPHLR